MAAIRRVLALIPFVLLGAVQPAPAAAQQFEDPLSTPRWVGDAAAAGVNSLLGGLTAGAVQKLRGGSFQDGFTRGAVGGAVVYTGKRLAVQDFRGAGFWGREVAALGSSIVHNAGAGRPALERVMLPVGPVNFYLSTVPGRHLRMRLDGATIANALHAMTVDELEFDAESSWSSGAIVFRARDVLFRGADTPEEEEVGSAGRTRAGVIYLSAIPGLDYRHHLKHERIHVLQNDQFFLTMTSPVEEWTLRRLPGGATVGRFVDLNLSSAVTGALAEVFKRYEHRPWELEAEYLARR